MGDDNDTRTNDTSAANAADTCSGPGPTSSHGLLTLNAPSSVSTGSETITLTEAQTEQVSKTIITQYVYIAFSCAEVNGH